MVTQHPNFVIQVVGAGGAGGAGGGARRNQGNPTAANAPPGMQVPPNVIAGAGGTGGGNASTQQQNFLKSLAEFEAIKVILTTMKTNSQISNTYLGAMGKMFGAAMDLLLIPFLPVLNAILMGEGLLIKWLLTSGVLDKIYGVVQDVVKKGEELISYIIGLPDKFTGGILQGLMSIAGDIGTAIGNAIKGTLPQGVFPKGLSGGPSGAGWASDLKNVGKTVGIAGLAKFALGGLPIAGGIASAPWNIGSAAVRGIGGALGIGGGGGAAAAGGGGAAGGGAGGLAGLLGTVVGMLPAAGLGYVLSQNTSHALNSWQKNMNAGTSNLPSGTLNGTPLGPLMNNGNIDMGKILPSLGNWWSTNVIGNPVSQQHPLGKGGPTTKAPTNVTFNNVFNLPPSDYKNANQVANETVGQIMKQVGTTLASHAWGSG